MKSPVQAVVDSLIKTPSRSAGAVSGDPDLQHPNYLITITQQQDATGGKPRVVVGTTPDTMEFNQQVGWKAPWGGGVAGEGAIADVMAVMGNRLVAQVMTLKVWQGSTNDFNFTVQFQFRAWSDPETDVMEPIRDLLRMSMPSLSSEGFLMSPGPILTTDSLVEGSKDAATAVMGAISGIIDDVKSITGGSIGSAVSGAVGSIGSSVSGAVGSLGSSVGGAVSNTATQVPGAMQDSSSLMSQGMAIKDSVLKRLGETGLTKKSFLESKMKNIISISIGTWFSMNNVLIEDVRYTLNTQTPYVNGLPTSADVTINFIPMFAVTQEDIKDIMKSAPR